jgi:dimethylargininase
MLALTHLPSPRLQHGLRTHVERSLIDFDRALEQHAAYCLLLLRCGADVLPLNVNAEQPDAVFIEDTAVMLDEVAILASMGNEARRAELAGIEPVLRQCRDVRRIELPATLEGGDVLRIGRTLLVGLSSRTNAAGVAALADIVQPHGYRVNTVPVRDCLHLKTACTALPDGSLIVNPAWLDTQAVRDFKCLTVPPDEPLAANTLTVGEKVCIVAGNTKTAELLRGHGFAVETAELSEFAKAEGGITCLSLLFHEAAV